MNSMVASYSVWKRVQVTGKSPFPADEPGAGVAHCLQGRSSSWVCQQLDTTVKTLVSICSPSPSSVDSWVGFSQLSFKDLCSITPPLQVHDSYIRCSTLPSRAPSIVGFDIHVSLLLVAELPSTSLTFMLNVYRLLCKDT